MFNRSLMICGKLERQGRSHQNPWQVATELQNYSKDNLEEEELVQTDSHSHCLGLTSSREGCLYASVTIFGSGFLCAQCKGTNDLRVLRPCLHRCFGLAWINARCPPKPHYHSPSPAGQRRGSMMKGSRVETRTGRDHSPINTTDKTD